MVEDNPLDWENIKEKQDEDNDLQQSLTKHPTWCSRKNINDINNILCYTKPGDNAASWKIVLPKDLMVPTISWYHQVTGHPGSKRLDQHIHQRYYNCDLRRLVDNFKCNYCRRNKVGDLFIYLALAKPALPGQFVLLVSSQSKEKVEPKQSIPQQHSQKDIYLNISRSPSSTECILTSPIPIFS